MMDYRATESTLCGGEVAKEATIKDAVQEAKKILQETTDMLIDMENIISGCCGPANSDVREAKCLADDAKQVVGLAYECMNTIKRIKGALL